MIIVTSSSSKNSDFQKFLSTLTRKAGVIKYGERNRIQAFSKFSGIDTFSKMAANLKFFCMHLN